MIVTAWACPTCSRTHLAPWTTCPRCEPGARTIEQQRLMERSVVEGRPIALDRYSQSMLVVVQSPLDPTAEIFVTVRDAHNFIDDEWQGTRDKLISDVTRYREENTELLAENARLRRRLEKPR